MFYIYYSGAEDVIAALFDASSEGLPNLKALGLRSLISYLQQLFVPAKRDF